MTRTAALAVLHIFLLLSSAAAGHLRMNVTQSKFFNPVFTERIGSTFSMESGPTFRIGGGVFLDGSAEFFLETAEGTTPILADEVTLRFSESSVFLDTNSGAFPLEMHEGLACPLSRMILRGGKIAYSLPPEKDSSAREALQAEGMVAVQGNLTGEAVAAEFADMPFYALVEGADYASTEPLSEDIRTQAIEAVSAAAGLNVQTGLSYFTYLNSDQQVTYQVFLVQSDPARVDIAGVPLRYYWTYDPERPSAPVITDIEIWSIAGLTETESLTRPMDVLVVGGFRQYDYIVLYQVAGLFRTLANTQPEAFRRFSEAACNE